MTPFAWAFDKCFSKLLSWDFGAMSNGNLAATLHCCVYLSSIRKNSDHYWRNTLPYWYCERIYKKASTLWASTKKYLSMGNLYAREYANLQMTMGTHQTSR